MAKKANGIVVDDYVIPDDGATGNTGGTVDNPKPVDGVSPDSGGGGNIAGFAAVDPGDGGDTGSGSGSGRRGRPRGSKNKASGSSKDLGSIEGLLLSTHVMLAAIVGEPDLALDPSEAKQVSEAVQNVARLYDHKVNPRTMAWLQLAFVMGGVYGTRAVSIYRKHSKPAGERGRVVPIRPEPSVSTGNVAAGNRTEERKAAAPPPDGVNGFAYPSDLFGPFWSSAAIANEG